MWLQGFIRMDMSEFQEKHEVRHFSPERGHLLEPHPSAAMTNWIHSVHVVIMDG